MIHLKNNQTQRLVRVVLIVIAITSSSACSTTTWREASRESANIAPIPSETKEAVVQVYVADVWGWRGIFAVHTWLAVKPENADAFTVLEVIGWRQKQGLPVLRIEQDIPDRYWFGSRPELILDKRGEGVSELIEKILYVSKQYPWSKTYKMFPGPNSNTYPAWIAEKVPELGLELPFSAIGSGWSND